jgi:nitrate reductase NapE component
MATYTPPPYFPQSSLSPANKNRYRKFKLLMVLLSLVLVAIVGALGYGAWHLFKWLF